MKTLRTSCKKCEKPISFKLPLGDGEFTTELNLNYVEAQLFMSHSVICGGCKTENSLMVDTVKLKVV